MLMMFGLMMLGREPADADDAAGRLMLMLLVRGQADADAARTDARKRATG